MTRVLQVLGRSAGGIARHVAQLVGTLDGRDGLEVDVAGPPDLPLEMPKQMHHVVIPDGPLAGHRGAIGTLRKLIREQGYDVVHAHGIRAGLDASLAVGRRDGATLVTIHNLVLAETAGRKLPLYRLAESLAVRLSDRTFAVSADIAAHLHGRAGSARAKVEVLHLGAGSPPVIGSPRSEIRARLGVPDEEALILSASRLSPQKSVDVMLHAFALLPPRSVLAILGVGPLASELRALAEQLGVADRIRWLGFRSDIADHIAAADVFCLSSIWEGVPLAAMEAVQLGTVVVGTAVGGMPELISDGRSGRLVEPRNARALAAALVEVLEDEQKRKRFVETAAADLEVNFSTSRMLGRLRAAYAEAADA